MPPETIAGRYDVVREVGRGGMGAVWLCLDRTLGREVAVKQVGGLPGESTPHLARALREARSSAALNHPNVVSIYDAIEDGGHVWLVMEYLPSRTLSEVLKDGPLDERRAAHLGAQVADGLAAAHERGTVHRDVKPGNILVTDGDVAKISDFGIARTLGEEQLTQTGLVSGTPLYFSPSLARGHEPTPADDVWALGATLYAAVEGEPPWPAQENSIAMLMHIVNHEPPVPQRAGTLTDPIRRMMDLDPAGRPTMPQAARELRGIASGTADPTPTVVLAAAVPPSSGPDEPRRRRGGLAVIAAVAVLLLALGAALLLGLLAGGDDGPGTASDEPTAQESSEPPSDEPSEEPSREPAESAQEPSEEPTPEETASEEPTTSAPVTEGGEAAQVVEDYYAILPSDTRSAWRVLSPASQQEVGNYGRYRGFWRTIDSVAVEDVEETGDGRVLVDLVYNGSDRETRELFVADGLITDGGIV